MISLGYPFLGCHHTRVYLNMHTYLIFRTFRHVSFFVANKYTFFFLFCLSVFTFFHKYFFGKLSCEQCVSSEWAIVIVLSTSLFRKLIPLISRSPSFFTFIASFPSSRTICLAVIRCWYFRYNVYYTIQRIKRCVLTLVS